MGSLKITWSTATDMPVERQRGKKKDLLHSQILEEGGTTHCTRDHKGRTPRKQAHPKVGGVGG